MAEQNPTVIIAHLDDEKLRKSIDSLVGYVDEKFKAMTTSTTNAVNTMQQSLNKLGELKITSTGSGGESRSTAIKKEKREVEDLKVSYDQMAQALQKATRYPSEMRMQDQSKSARDSYLAFMQGYKAQGGAIARQIQEAEAALNRAVQNRVADLNAKLDNAKKKLNELYTTLYQEQEKARSAGTLGMPFNAGIERTQQSIEYAKKHIEELNAAIAKVSPNMFTEQVQQIEQLRARRERVLDTMKEEVTTQQQSVQVETQQLNIDTKRTEELQKQIGLIQSRGDAKKTFENAAAMPVDTYEQAQEKLRVLESLKEKVANTPLFSKNQTQALGNEIEKVRVKMSFLYRTTEEGVAEEKARVAAQNKLMQDRLVQIEKEKAALKERGLAAQQSANAIREAMRDQLQDNMATGTQQAIRGLKDLQQHIRDMQRAFGAMNQEEQESPIGRALKNDIRLAREAMVAVSKYNLSAVTGRQTPIEGLERFDSYKLLSQRVSRLTKEYQDLTAAERDAEKGKGMAEKIQLFSRALQEIQRQMSRPVSLKSAFGLEENTLERIAYKMQQLNAYKMGLDITAPKQVAEMKQVEQEYDRLKKKSDELMGKNQQLLNSNNALTRSWNYMKNRLAFYFTVGASTAFVKNLIEVRSQYEMNERALGILIDSAERGTQIFNELSQMALVSPYTLIELSTAAKQLTAYDVAAKDVVDTTRRLADMAAAVGIPIERLTYALGQIKAYGYLNSRDARMFLNAGIPLVRNLADHYTELEGKMVSVGDVYDRMKKKAIGYNDVMAVITEMTDEGGKFFDFQAKMADTLKVQLANLTLAWNNMLNEIGKSEQGVLVGGIKGLKELFLQWKNIEKAVLAFGISLGVVKTAQILYLIFGAKINKQLAVQAVLGQKAAHAFDGLGASLMKVATNPWTWVTIGIAMLANLALTAYQADEAIKTLNKSIIDAANERVESINKTIANLNSQYNFEEFAPAEHVLSSDVSKDEAKKIWETIREEIEMSSSSAQEFINRLENIDDINVRVGKGFDYLKDIQKAQAALSQLDIKDIDVEQDMAGWYNLYLLQDGLIENFRDMQKEAGRAEKDWKDYAIRAAQGLSVGLLGAIIGGIGIKGNAGEHLKRYQDDLQTTVDSIIASMKKYNVEGANAQREFFATSMDKILQDTDLTEKERLKIRIDAQELFYQSEVKSRQKAIAKETGDYKTALQQELNDFIAFHEQRNGYTLGFEQWLQKTQITMLAETFGKMSAEELKHIDFSKGEWSKWAYEISKKFAEQNNLAFDDVFSNLRKYLSQDFVLYIKTVLQKPDDKSLVEQLSSSDERLAKVNKDIERLNKVTKASKNYAQAQKEINELEKERAGLEKEDAIDDKKAKQGKQGGTKKDVFGDALSKEIQYISDIQKRFKEYQKMGVDAQQTLTLATDEYGKSIIRNNAILQKYGVKTLSSEQLATMPLQEIRDFYQEQLNGATSSTKGVEALEKAIANLNMEITKIDYKRITDGLNNELSKIKDEYELAVELDANPELGGAFADLFGINTDKLPQTFSEAFDRANKVAKEKLSELKVDVKDFDLLSTKVKGDDKGFWMGIDVNSDFFKELTKGQQQYREMLKKNLTETEKALDDYVKKYGDYSDKIAEIEADRIEKVKRLNDAYYSEELRKRPEYIAKLNAIEQGAAREKQQVDFEDFKNSRYYTQMFENLDHVSSVTIRAMRDRLRDLIDNMNDLTPEQLKQVMQQYEKLEQKLTKRNPFRNLTKDLSKYIKTTKERRKANQEWSDIDKAYRAQEKVVAAIKEKMEQEKAYGDENSTSYIRLLQEFGIQQEILDILKQQVAEAEKKAQKYNLIKKFALEEASAAVQMVAGNLTSLGDIRDTLDGFGINLGDDLDAIIDDLGKVGEGINQITSSATSGNVVGVVSGVVKSIGGLGDSIASIFGGGTAKTKRLNREIARSQESVRQLQQAYQRLEREVNKASGTQETWAKRQQIANKEEEMKELQRQMQLEQSKRSKDRDDAAIQQYKETIDSLWYEIQDLKNGIVNDLLGSDVKSAAQEFVDTWVDAWRQGETTLDAVTSKMDEMIMELIKRAASSAIVQRLLQPLYSQVDKITSEDSEGGVKVTMNEIKALADLSQQVGVNINDALGAFYGQLEQIGAVSKDLDAQKQLSNLQQGIQGVTEETASALEAYMNGVSQQVYLQSDLLTQIRDAVVAIDSDAQLGVQAQMLLQLQQSYAIQVAIQGILAGWSNPSGLAVRVEMV